MTDEQTKTCTKCGETKPLSEFYKKSSGAMGRTAGCKICTYAEIKSVREAGPENFAAIKAKYYLKNRDEILSKEKLYQATRKPERAEYNRIYHANNRDENLARSKKYYEENRERLNEESRKYHLEHKDEVREIAKAWRIENREHIAEKSREAYASTPSVRIRQSISTSVRRALSGDKKSKRTFEILGYTLEELMAHLEAKFLPGMTWENYGYYGWHIDHRRPQASFQFTSIEDPEFKACWELPNLQPMWWLDNISKGAKWAPTNPSNDNVSEAIGRAG